MKTEAVQAIEYLLDKLAGGTECRNSVFRLIPGMLPDTARRRLNDYRILFEGQVFEGMALYHKGWTCNRGNNVWSFTKPFLKFLRQQIAAADRLERQNAKVKNEN